MPTTNSSAHEWYVPSFARATASSRARRESTSQSNSNSNSNFNSRATGRQADTSKLSFRTPSVPFHPSTSRPPSALSENYSRRSSSISISRTPTLTRPSSRASNYPLSSSASISARAPSVSMSNTHQPSYRPPRSIRSPTMTRKKKPQPQPQPQPQIYEVELAKRLKVVEKERFQEGLMLLNEEWQELEALTLMDESEKNGDCMGMDMDMDMGMGMGKPIVKKASKPGPAPALSPGPGPIFKVSAVPAILSKFEVICDSLSYSHKSSDCSEQSFHTARSDCTNESFHTAPGGSDGDGDGEKEADAEAEKAFLNSRIICEHWQVELDRAQDERADSTIREIANIGRERE